MDNILTTLDFVVFFGSLLAVMGVGLWVARRDGNGTADYYLASKDTPWWAVAGSIFGSNVSANHMVGMMAVGFGAGFVISHFEFTPSQACCCSVIFSCRSIASCMSLHFQIISANGSTTAAGSATR